ncbi:MAG: transglutaminase domain-containing protein [Verrucomicrobiota bacterium]
MNISPWRWVSTVVVVCALAAAAWARPPEWAQAHLQGPVADGGTKGAVILMKSGDIRYLTEDRVRRTYRGVIRVIAQQGRARAFCSYGLNPNLEKIISAQAWVVAPDGKKSESFPTHRFTDMPQRVGSHFWNQYRIITFDAEEQIAVGGALVWEFQVESLAGITDISWNFDSSLPVRLNRLEITPVAGGRVEWHASSDRIPGPAPGGAPGSLRWEMRETVPAKGEEPDDFLEEDVVVSARGLSAQGKGTIGSWPDFAKLAAGVLEGQTIVADDVKAKAEAVVAGKTGRWERIRALAHFVQTDIVYLSVTLGKDYLAGYRPHLPAEVLKNRFGDCKDKVTLLTAMLRATGETALPVLVSSGDPRGVRREWPAAVFNHVIVGLPADDAVPKSWPVVEVPGIGRLVLFDPTDSLTPLGFLSVGDQSGLGLVADPRAQALIDMPADGPENSRYHCAIEATLDANGTLQVRAKEHVLGRRAVARAPGRARTTPIGEPLSVEQAKKALEARLRDSIPIVQDLKWTDKWDGTTAESWLEFEFKAERYARKTGSLLMVSPQVLLTKGRLAPWKTDAAGVAWMDAERMEKEVTLTLPAGTEVEELPDDISLESPRSSGRLTYRKAGDGVAYRFEFTQRGGLLERTDYEEVRTFVQKLSEAERRPILLRRSAAAPAAGADKK